MTEQELRVLVRQAIARAQSAGEPSDLENPRTYEAGHRRTDASHAMFVIPDGSEQDGPCIIEPAVSCNHCGYCKSLGH